MTWLLALAAAHSSEPDYSQIGLALMGRIQAEFRIEGSPCFAETLGSGKDRSPAFNWTLGVHLSALAAAARRDPKWKKDLAALVTASKSYWNPSPPVAGFDVLPLPKPADRYYDDNAWMALALCEASQVLNDPAILELARRAADFSLSGWDERLGGGIYWRESEKTSKNTCSNAPVAAACLALFRKTGDAHLVDRAKAIYNWTKARLEDPADHLYWDNIQLDGKLDRTKWTYNTGMMIVAAAELASITGDTLYLRDADAMAAASEKRWIAQGRLADEGKFAFLLLEGWRKHPSAERNRLAREALRWLAQSGRGADGWFGNRFDRPPDRKRTRIDLIDQAAVARAFLMAL